ncbi:hypothetical protein [Haladaptatus sp. NG-WS-4]
MEHIEGERQTPAYDPERAVTLVHNHSDPMAIVDGIDRVIVIEKKDNQYLIDYLGFMSGFLRITHEGVAELGELLLGLAIDMMQARRRSQRGGQDDCPSSRRRLHTPP